MNRLRNFLILLKKNSENKYRKLRKGNIPSMKEIFQALMKNLSIDIKKFNKTELTEPPPKSHLDR